MIPQPRPRITVDESEYRHLIESLAYLIDRARYYEDWPASRSECLTVLERLLESATYCERTRELSFLGSVDNFIAEQYAEHTAEQTRMQEGS